MLTDTYNFVFTSIGSYGEAVLSMYDTRTGDLVANFNQKLDLDMQEIIDKILSCTRDILLTISLNKKSMKIWNLRKIKD